jgi:uncharacterized surface protein with fasciclin (FAS1) repeats
MQLDRRSVLSGIAGTTALLVGGAGAASARRDTPAKAARRGERAGASAESNLVETAIELNSAGPFAGQFDTLIAAVTEAGLLDTLGGNRQLTVFAPTDAGFQETLGIGPDDVGAVDDETLVSVLTYHVTPGRRYAASVVDASQVPTLNGERVAVDGTTLNGDQADIVATNVEAENGVIHAIDGVLVP